MVLTTCCARRTCLAAVQDALHLQVNPVLLHQRGDLRQRGKGKKQRSSDSLAGEQQRPAGREQEDVHSCILDMAERKSCQCGAHTSLLMC